MIRKNIILFLIVLNLNCLTLSMMKSANNDGPESAYFPYTGTLGNVGIILFGPFFVLTNTSLPGKITGQGESSFLAFWLSRFIDLPLCLITDTVLLPGTLPYYIYVKSGRPWSSGWYHEKYEKRVTSFRDQNPPYIALKSIISSNDLTALQRFLKLYDVVALEKKIRYLQEKDLLPYEHSWTYNFYSGKVGIIDYIASFASIQTTFRKNIINPGDRFELVYTLYEEFRKDPELEKVYYDTVWKAYFSSGKLIQNPTIFKKVFQEFSDRKEISDLFKSTALGYLEKESKQTHNSYLNSKTTPPQISERWYEKIDLLTEMDDLLRKNPELLKEWKSTAWISAISSGVIVHRPLILEKAFREFPMETANASFSLFIEANKGKNQQSIDIIVKNLKDENSFPLERLTEETVIDILKYSNLLEKLLQTEWDPNSIIIHKPKLKFGQSTTEETSLLILAMEENSIPAETCQILLKYGANPNLGVKRKSQGKEYILYPLAAINPNGNDILRESKQKILINWKK
ncbi:MULTISPECIES: hypothetical protein [Leptospira]|uniref:PF07119 family protein n=1 Tax=Leptospira interrogans serovar Lora str. TE 1992 TaxID=1193028 RepID=M3CQH8_LEPIR|nr:MULTISPECIES: hypothetical protein [Leptospira]EMF43874.1 hypothetical protein LEP1GSC067_1709 [Leptospira interrogans serovar Lora str. TE 1992]AKH78711.1 hypothetical protein BRAT_17745 [Leptospira interrogans serovar Bratislava]EMN09397.1 hypothetical protein LEP1GSC053_0952 [Leptospira interrogans serovar Muenchen str. Brem 129]KLO75582.1 Uncharacterized protein AAY48_3333 [Leptospira interrogans serovar Muenchen]KWV25024.1 hypothetical protein LA733_1597 [Leptospira interrogans]